MRGQSKTRMSLPPSLVELRRTSRSSGLRFVLAASHLVVAAGAGRRAAELGIAGATQRGRTIRISVRIAVVRMQDDVRSSVSDYRFMMRRICKCIRA